MYNEIKFILADCLFCLASQHPLEKNDTLRLIAYLKKNGGSNADGTLDLVTLCLIISLLYCFDVSVLEDDNNSGTVCFVQNVLKHMISISVRPFDKGMYQVLLPA